MTTLSDCASLWVLWSVISDSSNERVCASPLCRRGNGDNDAMTGGGRATELTTRERFTRGLASSNDLSNRQRGLCSEQLT